MTVRIFKAKNILTLGIALLLVYMFAHPQKALHASQQGLLLWFHTLLPTLLPFMILSNLVIRLGTAEKLLSPFAPLFRTLFGLSPAGTYVYLLGLLCGYPMGAKLTADLYKEKRIPKSEAMYLLTFSNNPSPAFLSSYVLLQCLCMPQYTLASFGILYASNYITCLFFRRRYRTAPSQIDHKRKEISPLPPAGKLLDISIMNAFETITRLGGFIILFSVLSAALNQYLALGNATPFFLGIFEISTGLPAIAASPLSAQARYILSMGCTSLGGLCVLAQTNTVIRSFGLPLLPYVEGKLLNASLALLFSLLFIKCV
ncbi:MAG: sporulation protein [Lachnospiraceae bacterium]|nr:sporulation protein [Lachnospiraceae bacterium]